jgi:regulator of nucleoside diphosphate kinase
MPEIIIGAHDHHDLLLLSLGGRGGSSDITEDLLHKLERARIVAERQFAPDIVQIGSTVLYHPDNGPDRRVTLVFPADADISFGKISVLTPIGTALLGLRAGQRTTWTARDGRDHVLRVLRVSQPATAPSARASASERLGRTLTPVNEGDA